MIAPTDGEPLTPLLLAALGDPADDTDRAPARELFFLGLLEHALCIAEVGPGASPGPQVKLGSEQMVVRLVESNRLGAPVVPLFTSARAMIAAAEARGLWPDRQERGAVVDKGAAFPLLRGHPGTLVVADADHSLALDAGDISALAERLTPRDYAEGLRKLVASGRPREAARRLATRPLYTLGHPQGGMLMFTRELPVFLHLATAEAFGRRLNAQTGQNVQHGIVAGVELFKNAVRGRLFVLVEPGPRVMRFKPDDLR